MGASSVLWQCSTSPVQASEAVGFAGLGTGRRPLDAELKARAPGRPQAGAALPAAAVPRPVALPAHCCFSHQVSIPLRMPIADPGSITALLWLRADIRLETAAQGPGCFQA